jgi:hypothetical protein
LRPNHSQTIDLGFKAQPRNQRSSSPHAQYRPHTVPPDLSIAQPPSIRPMRPSPVLCTRSPTLAMILVAARHAAPATYTPRDKQRRFSTRTKDKRKIKQNYPGFEFKPHQVNDSSQSKQGTDHLVSHLASLLRTSGLWGGRDCGFTTVCHAGDALKVARVPSLFIRRLVNWTMLLSPR